MKIKKLLCFFLMIVLMLSSCVIKNVSAKDNYDFYVNLKDYIVDNEVEIKNDNLEIYGNNKQLTEYDFYRKVSTGDDKIYLIYRTNTEILLSFDAQIVVKSNGVCKNYNYISYDTNSINLKDSICTYLDRNNESIMLDYNKKDISVISDEVPTTFIDSQVSTNLTLDFPKKGYIVSMIAFSEYQANDYSSIFIAKVKSTFVPGLVAYQNGDKSYDKWKNNSGYVHISIEQAYDKTEESIYGTPRYGSIPYFKDYWPCNEPSTVTISSSIKSGLVLGYSKSNGFSVNGNISYEYDKSITQSEPKVSAQLSKDLSNAQWSFTFKNNSEYSYDQYSNYMYEISRQANEMYYSDVRLKLDYQFVVDRSGFYTRQYYNKSLDLIVLPHQNLIYNFNNGMI